MKYIYALPVLLLPGLASAQLVNGSFENAADGWTVPCECAPAYFSSDVAPGNGNQCIGLENVHLDCGCMLQSVVSQPTPWVTPGTWQLSGWIKSAVPGDVPGSRIALNDGPVFSTPAVAELWSSTGEWEYVEQTFTVESFVNTDSLRVSLVPDDGNQQPLTLCYFDNIQLSAPQNIGADAARSETLHFRPNPATDKLWVDLSEAPISIFAIVVLFGLLLLTAPNPEQRLSILLIAAGAILTFAVDAKVSGIDLDVVGWVLMGAGVLAGIAGSALRSSAPRRSIRSPSTKPEHLLSAGRASSHTRSLRATPAMLPRRSPRSAHTRCPAPSMPSSATARRSTAASLKLPATVSRDGVVTRSGGLVRPIGAARRRATASPPKSG